MVILWAIHVTHLEEKSEAHRFWGWVLSGGSVFWHLFFFFLLCCATDLSLSAALCCSAPISPFAHSVLPCRCQRARCAPAAPTQSTSPSRQRFLLRIHFDISHWDWILLEISWSSDRGEQCQMFSCTWSMSVHCTPLLVFVKLERFHPAVWKCQSKHLEGQFGPVNHEKCEFVTVLFISLYSSKYLKGQLGLPVNHEKWRLNGLPQGNFPPKKSEHYQGLLIRCNEEARLDKYTNSFIQIHNVSKNIYSPKMYPSQRIVKPNDTILSCTHVWSTLYNPSWAPEARCETLRKPQNVPT